MKSFGLSLLLSASPVAAKLGKMHHERKLNRESQEFGGRTVTSNNNNNNTRNKSIGRQATLTIQWSTNFPLGTCQGDCDSDFDCQESLICYQRNEKQTVPGCLGGEHDWSKIDYCIPMAGTKAPLADETPKSPDMSIEWSTSFPLKRCQGDCDINADCEGNLICYQRNGYMKVPGCIGGEYDSSDVDYCVYPDDLQLVVAPMPSNAPVPIDTGGDQISWSTNFPLGKCVGDCDTNADCQDGLFCWQRDKWETIPGCSGSLDSFIDYCIPKSAAPGKKLKMHWDNYLWQESTSEFFWCMACTECDTLTTGDGWEGGCKQPSGNKCEEGHLIWIEECRDVRNRFEIIPKAGSGDQIRVYGTNLCFTNRENRWLELRLCNENNQNQLWTSMANRNKFEIRPYNHRDRSTKDALCISQLHHPKGTEVLSLRDCWLNIHYETNYWMEYYG